MPKVNLDDVASLANETSFIASFNANNALIEEGFNNTISRNGLSPNTMESMLDMNNHRLVNVPLVPLSNSDVATKYYVDLRAGDLSDTTPTNPNDAIVEGDLSVGGDLTVTGSITGTVSGLVIGTDVQAWDDDLDDLAALTPTDGNFIVGDGTNWTAESGATARTSLGVDAAGTDNSTNVTLAGSLDYITLSGQEITRNAIDLTTDVTGDLPVADGGTGRSSSTAYAVICGGTTGTAAQQSIASVGSSGQVLTSNGAGALPTFQAASGGGITSVAAQATTSGTAINFTSLPAGLNRITVVFDGVSLDAANNLLVQIGDSGGLETTGYDYQYADRSAESSAITNGFAIENTHASGTHYGHMILTRIAGTNRWIASHTVSEPTFNGRPNWGAGGKTLSAELDRLTLTRNSSGSFDAGQVSIFYE